MKLQFVEITKRKGKETKKRIYYWSDVPEGKVGAVCQNFMDGFLLAMSIAGRELRRPIDMMTHGWSAQTWRYHDSDSGTLWQFENGRGVYITNWRDRISKKKKN